MSVHNQLRKIGPQNEEVAARIVDIAAVLGLNVSTVKRVP
jgi:hypothetical protein